MLTHIRCTYYRNAESYKVIIGDSNSLTTGDGEQYFNVKAIIDNPGYITNNPLSQAFSLMQLNASVVIPSPTTGIVCLPTGLSQSLEGETLKLSGWGRTSVGGPMSCVLKAATGKGYCMFFCVIFQRKLFQYFNM